MRRLIDP